MAAERRAPLTAHRNSDDNKWYYRINRSDEAGPAIGPFHSVEEAIEASRRYLPADEIA
ncbi:hypothetical protein [Mesorhizobium marinum]|uniref:DUF2188 domain-containing protein n=1 Tax=Mesorhizobium marinum TaxID=3228790 RepID=A0ABV3QV05_9HYPH